MKRVTRTIGSSCLNLCALTGRFFLFFTHAIRVTFCTRLKMRTLLAQMNIIGVESFAIIVLTGTFTGMVFALQSYIGFQRIGGEQYIGSVVALGMIRELGPVLTGLMVTGRAGSAITAEIDALPTLRINPFQYLVVPRILAGLVTLPCLTIFSMMFGIAGGYIMCVHVLGLSCEDYINSINGFVGINDIAGGLMKSCIFGIILTWVGTYKGFHTRGGARGVGIATTESVVLSSIIILIGDYILTKLIEQL